MAEVQKLEHNRTLQVMQAIGLPEMRKPRYYVFAAFSAHHLNHFVLLNYTTDPPQPGTDTVVHKASTMAASHQEVVVDEDGDEFQDASSSFQSLSHSKSADTDTVSYKCSLFSNNVM